MASSRSLPREPVFQLASMYSACLAYAKCQSRLAYEESASNSVRSHSAHELCVRVKSIPLVNYVVQLA
ncbi:hypothetical protein ACLB2K_046488 [Fragaria x ananassa]